MTGPQFTRDVSNAYWAPDLTSWEWGIRVHQDGGSQLRVELVVPPRKVNATLVYLFRSQINYYHLEQKQTTPKQIRV